MKRAFTLGCALCFLGLAIPAHAAGTPRPPNIIVILADDLGLSRVGCYGGGPFRTPHIDRLASLGMRFERCYSMPICGPSRAALLTGKYPFRTGAIDNSRRAEIDPDRDPPLSLVLQRAGYATCAIGKLGQSAPANDNTAPARLGFDEWMLWMGRGGSDRYWAPRYHSHRGLMEGRGDEYGPDLNHEFLVDFMRRHQSRPFFVYYSSVLVHWPVVRTPRSTDDSRVVEDMVSYFDELVGRLYADLERLGILNETYIILTSDNGPQNEPLGTVAGLPMLGAKGDASEGGVRQPLIVHGPGVPKGAVCADLTDFTDFFPTVLELAGVQRSGEAYYDGRSIAPQIHGRRGEPREWVYAQYGQTWFVADASYKLYGDGRFVTLAGSPHHEHPSEGQAPPERLARERLESVLRQLRATVFNPPPRNVPSGAGKP